MPKPNPHEVTQLLLAWSEGDKVAMDRKSDVRNLLAVECDFEYLRRHAERLGVDELLAEVETTDASDE